MRHLPVLRSRACLRLSLLAATAALLTGCADSSRFSDPFGNPFQSSSASNERSDRVDHTPTGSVPRQRFASNERIVGQPLPPASNPAPASMPPQAGNPPLAAPRPTGTAGNWTAQGGTPIVVAQGESASALADRYGVPVDALIRTNGFNTASQVQPGARLVIPVYSTSARATPSPAPAALAPEARAPMPQGHPHETLRMVKGPQPAADKAKGDHSAKSRLMERGKVARTKSDDDADEAPVSKKAQPKPVPMKPASHVDATPDVKPAPQKQAKIEKPEVRRIDPEPTASLPPQADTPKATDKTADANPEFRWPARGRVIQGFKSGGNDGINIAVPEGTPVKAAEDGVVAYAGSELKGYGNLVLIRHPNGFVSAYANNGSLDVKRGETVKRGQTIAKSGQTGNVASPQLHFELRKGSTPVDPTNFLAGM